MKEEIYISVDIEAAGPIPGEYSMLSIGACAVGHTDESFYVELKPINSNAVPEAMAVSKLDLEALAKDGKNPAEAMAELNTWLHDVAEGRAPIFVGFNASFDWAFVNWYFHTFLGQNPFGFGALDIKAYYMGLVGCTWDQTRSSQLPSEFRSMRQQTHNALEDARAQADIFEKLLAAKRS